MYIIPVFRSYDTKVVPNVPKTTGITLTIPWQKGLLDVNIKGSDSLEFPRKF